MCALPQELDKPVTASFFFRINSNETHSAVKRGPENRSLRLRRTAAVTSRITSKRIPEDCRVC